jgi:hypothetical protein
MAIAAEKTLSHYLLVLLAGKLLKPAERGRLVDSGSLHQNSFSP